MPLFQESSMTLYEMNRLRSAGANTGGYSRRIVDRAQGLFYSGYCLDDCIRIAREQYGF
jgi:hypothetical protein